MLDRKNQIGDIFWAYILLITWILFVVIIAYRLWLEMYKHETTHKIITDAQYRHMKYEEQQEHMRVRSSLGNIKVDMIKNFEIYHY